MKVQRGDVVFVDFPFSDRIGSFDASLMRQVEACLKASLDLS